LKSSRIFAKSSVLHAGISTGAGDGEADAEKLDEGELEVDGERDADGLTLLDLDAEGEIEAEGE